MESNSAAIYRALISRKPTIRNDEANNAKRKLINNNCIQNSSFKKVTMLLSD